ncbi:WD repeat-containing protein 46 [Neodiprion pinetum]|uniref:WD repeat-containing protein 46 n=1 Tax=Neodiprion pinetum TaxID=441929 RepID=UPI001EE11ABC|nr:WD repeat-containing protein 46 [Neodiprion pinetum]
MEASAKDTEGKHLNEIVTIVDISRPKWRRKHDDVRSLRLNKRGKYPGKAPVAKEKLEKHSRGPGINLTSNRSGIRTKVHRDRWEKKERAIEYSTEQAARTELLLTEAQGFLEPDAGETTTQYTQGQIAENVDITSATKQFNINLDFGSYRLRYTRNGRHLILGGKLGHVAAFDWVTKTLACEMNVMESVHDVAWLHIETMFAVAQKQWVHIYDNQGIEIHCLKNMNKVTRLEFLPYHFLLASASEEGYLAWLDVSIGKMISRYNTKLGNLSVMTQNPSNAILCVGHAKGVVSMWSPNTREPVAKMLCHKQAIAACAVHPHGTYMATSCPDRSLRIWDVRKLSGPLHTLVLRSAAQELSYSQKGLLSVASGNIVEVYKDWVENGKPYLRHKSSWGITGQQFCPYEDVLGIATAKGFQSLLVPGSAEANFDALESNPFQTKSQRREAEVKALLDKIQPELITLEPSAVAEVDLPTMRDQFEAKKKLLHLKPKKINFEPRKTKAKGKGGTAKIVKTKKILKDLSRQETIKTMHEDRAVRCTANKLLPGKSHGVLDRFLPKTMQNTN